MSIHFLFLLETFKGPFEIYLHATGGTSYEVFQLCEFCISLVLWYTFNVAISWAECSVQTEGPHSVILLLSLLLNDCSFFIETPNFALVWKSFVHFNLQYFLAVHWNLLLMRDMMLSRFTFLSSDTMYIGYQCYQCFEKYDASIFRVEVRYSEMWAGCLEGREFEPPRDWGSMLFKM